MLSARDIREFRGFLRNATDRQVQGIYDKEKRAGRDDYAELAVAEAERRGIFLELIDDDSDSDSDNAHSTKKSPSRKSPAQLDREIAAALAKGARAHARVGSSQQAWDVSLDGKVIDTVFYDPDVDADYVRRGLVNHDGYDARIKVRRSPRRSSGTAHATMKGTVPGIAKWHMTAGGTSAAEGKHGYTFTAAKGEYHISPYTTKRGRHAGYALKYAATGGAPRGGHGGLWHDLGTHRSPAGAAKAAREHYARSFE